MLRQGHLDERVQTEPNKALEAQSSIAFSVVAGCSSASRGIWIMTKVTSFGSHLDDMSEVPSHSCCQRLTQFQRSPAKWPRYWSGLSAVRLVSSRPVPASSPLLCILAVRPTPLRFRRRSVSFFGLFNSMSSYLDTSLGLPGVREFRRQSSVRRRNHHCHQVEPA